MLDHKEIKNRKVWEEFVIIISINLFFIILTIAIINLSLMACLD